MTPSISMTSLEADADELAAVLLAVLLAEVLAGALLALALADPAALLAAADDDALLPQPTKAPTASAPHTITTKNPTVVFFPKTFIMIAPFDLYSLPRLLQERVQLLSRSLVAQVHDGPDNAVAYQEDSRY